MSAGPEYDVIRLCLLEGLIRAGEAAINEGAARAARRDWLTALKALKLVQRKEVA